MKDEETAVGEEATRPARTDYDFLLAIVTIALVSAVGLLFVGGTVYTFFAAQVDPAWTQTLMYSTYIEAMNSYLLPLLVVLIVTLGLCIPRRLFTRRLLVVVSAGMALVTLVLIFTASLHAAWLFLLGSAAAIQLVVILLTAARSNRLHYLQEGFLVRMGSALLHLGFIVLVAAFVLGLDTATQLTVFWMSTALIMLGMVMSFYSGELSRLGRRAHRTP